MKLTFNFSELIKIIDKLSEHVKPGKRYILDIREASKKRSLNQNAYYWGVIIPIFSSHTGYTKNEAHQELARMFLSYKHLGKYFVLSTADEHFTTTMAEKYYEECRQFIWHEYHEQVPVPHQITEEMYAGYQRTYDY